MDSQAESPAGDRYTPLVKQMRAWARELGFDALGIADIELGQQEAHLERWLEAGRHGGMEWMQRHGNRRSRPAKLLPGTRRVISVRKGYLSTTQSEALATLADPDRAYIARYALGRDYHKLIRKRLQKLADRISAAAGEHGYRVFSDSAPVLEKPLAAKAGLGWIGKHTLALDRHDGSWFFLGEIYTDLPLPIDAPADAHCGSCTRCIEVCPTGAITGPYQLDARRCIAYLTIENKGPIPEPLRPLMGNRVFGCDDCQLVCPWNRHAKLSREAAFMPRENLRSAALVELFLWSEERFLKETEGNPLRRVGHKGFLRNLAVALGNAPRSAQARAALESRLDDDSGMLREHVSWALARQRGEKTDSAPKPCQGASD
ncbi:MAG: tRNA epoxyqueuosine(34) reductase QueG [Gammaproteobacteria bacterium]|nr:tRNA epoxyqueuosine(34) reductase QueG [Gammaproteobacteria bacterium]